MKLISISIYGKVQGVFFRASAKQEADKLGIRGTVRNQQDGSVLIQAEGDEVILERFVQWCRKGPANANVTDIAILDDETKGFKNFEIIR